VTNLKKNLRANLWCISVPARRKQFLSSPTSVSRDEVENAGRDRFCLCRRRSQEDDGRRSKHSREVFHLCTRKLYLAN
jgi:hypothetical protein